MTGRGLVDPTEPVIRADDEGLLRGRAAFETLRVYSGRPFRLEAHLDRLKGSAASIGLPAVERRSSAGARRPCPSEGGARGRDPSARVDGRADRRAFRPRSPFSATVPEWIDETRTRGATAVSLLGVRASAPWLLPGVKSTSYAVNMAAEAEARRRGVDEALFVDADGLVLEGTVTNVWWRKGKILYTPTLDLGILAGVTRATLIELAPGVRVSASRRARTHSTNCSRRKRRSRRRRYER